MHFDTQMLILTIVIVGLVCLVLGMVLGASLTRPRYTRDGRY
jgi:hypothetical protein